MINQFETYIKQLNDEIASREFGNHPPELYDPIRYILALGGKRLRPLLTLLAYQVYRDDYQSILKPAIAVEVFHNFTLMHDDIMDNAPLRRGQPTVHEKWNDNIALVSGDTMLIKVYDLLLEIGDDKLRKGLTLFNKCATEVCEGQQIDINFESRMDVTVAEYLDMIKLKTAVLLGFSLQFGAVLADADDTSSELLREFGINIGIGFQLKDDLLDVYGEQEKFGKQVGGDIISNKKTYLLIQALANAKGSDQEELCRWIEAKEFDKTEKVNAVKRIYDSLDIKTITEQKMNEYFDNGFEHLARLDVPEEKKQMLHQFANYLINRER